MKNTRLWLLAVVFLVAWALYELYPPTGRSLMAQFERAAENTQDPTFQSILTRARELNAERPALTFSNLLVATGTNSLERYFPRVAVSVGKETNRFILYQLQRQALGEIKLGLDLQGGMSFMVQMDTNRLVESADRERPLDQAVEILRRRVDRFGVAEPVIQKAGADRILIQMPGLSEAEKAAVKRQIETAAFLEFRMVHPENDRLLAEGLVPPGYEVLTEVVKGNNGQEAERRLLVRKKPERGLTGKYVTKAMAVPDPLTGEPKIEFELDGEGAGLFLDITREYSPRPGGPEGTQYSYLAIVLDGVLYSAPRILGEIPGGRGVIQGAFDVTEAYRLAQALMNPLEAPVKILEERSVDPSLGADSIRSGVRASIIGTAWVALFMAIYYLLPGLIANVALVLNMLILLGVMCAMDTTLTLPGIAGIVLTAGMAVDASVLIYERIREELAAGKSPRGAINAGYNKAFWTIFDSNLTTLISSVILIFLGSGPVKGFGVTLSIGIAVNMFTSLIVTRLIFEWLLARNWLNLRMLRVIGETNIDFLKWAKPAFFLSWMLILIGIGYGIYRGKDVLGVDFAGGDAVTLSFQQKLGVDDVRGAISRAGLGEAQIQYQRSPADSSENLVVTTSFGNGEKISTALREAFPQAEFAQKQVEKIGPSVGVEIQLSAIKATLLALFGILVYVAFRYEFSFSVAAVVAIVHDVLMTTGWFFLTGREFSAPMVAAILTIIGFSINDTIVIFDRIREDLKLGMRGSFRDIINRALNQTLSRTIITSGTVFLATLALYLFGGGVINDFAFTFLVGILTGTYSTIYIASALVLWWHKGQRPVIGPSPAITTSAPQVQPARA